MSRADIDLEHVNTNSPFFAASNPGVDVLVNCAAYNFVDRAEAEPERAVAVNALGVRLLAAQCAARRIKFVHFSTDYVFGLDTTRTAPLTEEDPPGPLSVYGVSKLAGEHFARAASSGNLVIRTCGLYGVWGSGGKGSNFVETMLRLAGKGQPIRVVNDQHCTPSSTVDVAEATVALIRNDASGVFHVTNTGSCTWYEFATELFRLAKLKPDLIPITSAEYGAAARRPAFSVLSNGKLASAGISLPRPWPEALAAYLAERAKRSTGN